MTHERHKPGFTLVEIMIVVAIIAVLAVLALPAFSRARAISQNARFIEDLRVVSAAFQQHVLEHGSYPPDSPPGVVPPGMADELRGVQWTENTAIGGQWKWDYKQFGYTAGISVVFDGATDDDRLTAIDRMIDDGNLSTGTFRKRDGTSLRHQS